MNRLLPALVALLAWCSLCAAASANTSTLTVEHGVAEERAKAARIVRQAADGSTWVVWAWRSATVERILAARRPPHGTWSEPAEVTQQPRTAETLLDLRGFALAGGSGPVVTWTVGRDRGEADTLHASELGADARWHSVLLATAGGAPLQDAGAIVAASGGTTLVSWIEQEKTDHATLGRRALVAERGLNGDWRPPVSVVTVTGDARGAWLGSAPGGGAMLIVRELLDGRGDVGTTQVWALWEPATGWRVTAPERTLPLKSLFDDGVLGPWFGSDGRAIWLELYLGPYGVSGLGIRLQSLDGRTFGKADSVPRPSARQRRNGWLGSGYLNAAGVLLPRPGELVVGYGMEPADVEQGNFGMGSIWAATRYATGQWRVDPIDALAEMSDARSMVLERGADGRLMATWTVDLAQPGGCVGAVMRATRMADGRWTPRRLAMLLPRSSSTCATASFVLEGTDPVLGFHDRDTLRLVPLAEPSGRPASPPVLRPRLVTRRWSQVRAAGGVVIGCPSTVRAACSVSLLREREGSVRREAKRVRPPGRRAPVAASPRTRVVQCLPYRVGRAVGPHASKVVVPWYEECATRWIPPAVDLAFRVSLDVPGRRPAVTTLRVRIRR